MGDYVCDSVSETRVDIDHRTKNSKNLRLTIVVLARGSGLGLLNSAFIYLFIIGT
jgi:hypothetical protein